MKTNQLLRNTLLFAQICYVFNYQTCPKTDVVDDFDVEKMKGCWYIVTQFSQVFDSSLKCITADYYTGNNPNQIYKDVRGLAAMYGDPVKFFCYYDYLEAHNIANFNLTIVQDTGDFPGNTTTIPIKIIAMDYNSYVILYHCEAPSIEYLWVMSRTPPNNKDFFDEIHDILEDNGIDWSNEIVINHHDCDYQS